MLRLKLLLQHFLSPVALGDLPLSRVLLMASVSRINYSVEENLFHFSLLLTE